ncbi:hypothetical protein [Blastococcus sp. URHD0036]|uniref:hypothetical protein n=1 Tax=Blastococcus sp. URHD0036 TaxID=1380356 RepID=UPI0004956BC1|nr:hypothetical protein [Blastococcus sp. URHD0036]
MELLGPDVLDDPRYLVPAAPSGETGLAWLRARVPRFCDGAQHRRRRAAVDTLVAGLSVAPAPGEDPTPALLRALDLPAACAPDVAVVAAAYQPHTRQSGGADAALERLVEACGARDDTTAARICLLVQAHGALQALLEQRRSGLPGPPVPTTRRVAPDGRTVEVDLTGAPFGRGPHACPGRALTAVLVP